VKKDHALMGFLGAGITPSATFSYSLTEFEGEGFEGQGFCLSSSGNLNVCYEPSWGSPLPTEGDIYSMQWTFGTAFLESNVQWQWCSGSPRADGSCQLGSVNANGWCRDTPQSIQTDSQGIYDVQAAPNLSCTLASGGDTCTMSSGAACGTSVPTTDRCGLAIVAPCSCVSGTCTAGGTCQ
jgi:hypothetical protein